MGCDIVQTLNLRIIQYPDVYKRQLRRTEAAGFTLDDAVSLETVAEWMQNDGLKGKLLSEERLFSPYPAIRLNPVQTRMFLNGVRMDLNRIPDAAKADPSTPWRIFGADGRFLGLGQAFTEAKELRLLKFLSLIHI